MTPARTLLAALGVCSLAACGNPNRETGESDNVGAANYGASANTAGNAVTSLPPGTVGAPGVNGAANSATPDVGGSTDNRPASFPPDEPRTGTGGNNTAGY